MNIPFVFVRLIRLAGYPGPPSANRRRRIAPGNLFFKRHKRILKNFFPSISKNHRKISRFENLYLVSIIQVRQDLLLKYFSQRNTHVLGQKRFRITE